MRSMQPRTRRAAKAKQQRARVANRPLRKLGKRTDRIAPASASDATAAAAASGKQPKDNKALLLAQEVKFARLLANNDKRVRDKVLKNLRRWLTVRSQSSFAFTEEDFLRLWKGLFYCMWMSDKPLVQEELAESLSNLVHCFNSLDTALLYTKCTLKCLALEWFGIDRYRVDKFEMLVRKIVRQTFVMCKKQSWKKKWIVGVGKVMEEILLDPKTCLGLKLHITDLFMEELAKISDGQIPSSMVTEFIRPFVIYLASVDDRRQIKQIVKNVFRYLIFQSDVGMEYSEKFEAWRQAGFPCTNIEDMKKIEVSDDEDDLEEEEIENVQSTEKPLDPRAGRVDVEIPQLPFNPTEITKILQENKFHKSSTTLTRKNITQLINQFSKLSKGEMPLGIKEIPVPDTTRMNAYEAAEEFINFNKELYSDSSKNLKKRKKNGDLTEVEEDTLNNEVLDTDSDSSFVESESPKIKKRKIVKNAEIKEKLSKNKSPLSTQVQNSSETNQKLKRKLNENKKVKRLNVSDPLPRKQLKKLSKRQNSTFSENVDKSISDESINKKSSVKLGSPITNYVKESKNVNTNCTNKIKKGTSNNWSIEVATPEISKPSVSVSSDSLSTKVGTPQKNKAITKKIASNKSIKQNIPWLTPVLTRLEEQSQTPKSTKSALISPKTDSAKKRVKIALQNNVAQNTSEYIRQILKNPEIPFDANRKPKVGVLKASPLPSPINPFYKKKIF